MGKESGVLHGIIAYITTDKNRYLGGDSLAILAKDTNELTEISEAIADTFLADILQLVNGDYLIIKR